MATPVLIMRDVLFIYEAGDEIVDNTKLCFGDQELKESRVLIWKGKKNG
jgi:hypothetical protein